MNYRLVENFLPPRDHQKIQNFFLKDPDGRGMRWAYNLNVAKEGDNETFLFANKLWPPPYDFQPEYFLTLIPILYYSNISNIIRIKANCYVKQPIKIKTGIHTDFDIPHKVLLYSINTNNGSTILDPEGENIEIPSKANQALFFEGNIPHQAITQTDMNLRINLNICYN
tara:strand:- start:425 stop:931 length:507 start_codon:yes stop_codon:yes gene_type:complete